MERAEIHRRSSTNLLFGTLFTLIFVLALAPPLYIALSEEHALVAGVPGSIWYLLLVSAAPILVGYCLWRVEGRRGELD